MLLSLLLIIVISCKKKETGLLMATASTIPVLDADTQSLTTI